MDDLIDRALETYASREPSPSLECRILARVRAQRTARPTWLLAAAAVASACIGIALLPHHRAGHHVAQALPPVHVIEAQPYAAPEPIPPAHHHRRPPEPKLAVFPSPAPIPKAEIALAHALSADPELAASIVAKPEPIGPALITIEPLSIKALDED